MKMMLLKTWRDIKARKAQFAALIVLVALGISSYVGFISASENLEASLEKANKDLKLADFTAKVVMSPKTAASALKDIDGVAQVQGRLAIDTGLEYEKDKQAQARVLGATAGTRPSVNDVMILEGRYLRKNGGNECLINNIFADATGVKVGDTVKLQTDTGPVKLIIAGIVTTPEYFMNRRGKVDFASPKEFAVLFMDQKKIEVFFARGPVYNEYNFLFAPDANTETVIKEIKSALEPYKLITSYEQKDQPSNFGMLEEIRQNQEFGKMMPFIILFISVLTLAISLSRLVQSQRGEIGLSKALGYQNWQILIHYLLFSLFIAAIGSALGFALGQWFAVWETGLYADILNLPILETKIYPEIVANAIILSLASCIIAGIFPALRSARMLPAVAMRFDPSVAVSKGRVSLVERLFGWMIPKTFTVRLPLRDVTRARRRSAYTIIGIAFALILMVATWSMYDSMTSMLDYVFNKSMNYDIVAVFRQDLSPNQIAKIKSIDGVEKVQSALYVPVKITYKKVTHEGSLTSIKPEADFTIFEVKEGAPVPEVLGNGGIMLSETTAKKLKAGVGDVVSVKSPYITGATELEVKTITKELWGMNAYASLDQGAKLKGLPDMAYNAVYIDADNGDALEIKKELFAIPGAAMVSVKQDLKDMINNMMGFMWVFVFILFGFSFTMAFIVIYNTFTANVIERTREIATMMTIGEDRWHLAGMITLENVLLALLGVPFGLYLGAKTAQYMFTSLSTEAYSLDAVIFPMSFVYITLLILVVLLVSEIPPIRRIFKMDLAEATKTLD